MIEVDNITDVTLARLSKIRKNIRLLAFLITDFHSDGSCDCCDRGECCDCDKCSDFDKCCNFDDCFDCDDCCVITVTNDLNVTVVCDCDEYRDRKKFTDCDNCCDCN